MVRIKHRYLLGTILYPSEPSSNPKSSSETVLSLQKPTPDAFNAAILLRCIRDEIEHTFGEWGSAVAGGGINVKYFSNATSTFILRCPRDRYRLVWAALTYMTHLSLPKTSKASSVTKLACIMQVVHVSGTIRKAEEEAIRRARSEILDVMRSAEDGTGQSLDKTLSSIFGEKRRDESDVQMIEADDVEDEDDGMDH